MDTPPLAASDTAQDDAAEAGLVYVSDIEPGIRRRRSGKGFRYLSDKGSAVRDAATLTRIRLLAIPPAYTDVWICTKARGHLQATGRDARQRKQYRYHPEWQQARGTGKFDRIVAFGRALPRLRRRLRADLKLPGFPQPKVLAMMVAVMADTLMRVGNQAYARDNKSFGLTTLRSRHVEFMSGGRARFRFRGKSGKDQELQLDDARLVKLMRACQELPGQALFQYVDDEGQVRALSSGDVNDYLREAMGEAFTAKDFRTWGATLMAFQRFAQTPLPEPGRSGQVSERALAMAVQGVVVDVAAVIGNTPTVCRKSYVDPSVVDGWRDGSVQRAAAAARGARQWEQSALRFLQRAHRVRAKPA